MNPFSPNAPLRDFNGFAGRTKELKALVRTLRQIGGRTPRHTIVCGPRGIGKTSFINQINTLTTEPDELLNLLGFASQDTNLNFAVFKHRATKDDSVATVVSSLVRKMERSINDEGFKSKLSDVLDRVKVNIGVPGVAGAEFQLGNPAEISSDLVEAISHLWASKEKCHDGVIFVIDEIDSIAESTSIASFLKVTTEELAETGMDRIVFYLVGLTGALEKLKLDHPSIGRVFETIELLPMRRSESKEVISRALESIEDDKEYTFSSDAVNRIIEIASGFPHVIHLLSFYAFEHRDTETIDKRDLEYAITEVVTRVRRFELSQLFQKAGSGDYRNILIAMANFDETDIVLKEIGRQIGRPSNELSAYMTRLRDDGIIEQSDRALYRITEPLLKIYVRKLDVLEPQLPLDFSDDDI